MHSLPMFAMEASSMDSLSPNDPGTDTTPIRRGSGRFARVALADRTDPARTSNSSPGAPSAPAAPGLASNAAATTPPTPPGRTNPPRVSLPEGNGPPPPVVAQTPILPAPEVVETPCPRCGRKLINPLDLGWCQSCGYCQSL